MRKRFKMSRGGSRSHFTRNALRVHPRNIQAPALVMRGGIRL